MKYKLQLLRKKYWSSLKEIATINVFIFPYYICQ